VNSEFTDIWTINIELRAWLQASCHFGIASLVWSINTGITPSWSRLPFCRSAKDDSHVINIDCYCTWNEHSPDWSSHI